MLAKLICLVFGHNWETLDSGTRLICLLLLSREIKPPIWRCNRCGKGE